MTIRIVQVTISSFILFILLIILNATKRMKGYKKMKKGMVFIVTFIIWTILIKTVDVQAIGPNGTTIGFAKLNGWLHDWIGVHMTIYTITDWLGLVPITICMVFGIIGFVQFIKRKSIFKVDHDIMLLGMYYIAVICVYLVFEMLPMNYRPILIEGRAETSYPSSTTFLVLCVLLSTMEQVSRRVKHYLMKRILNIVAISFCFFMVIGRLVSGVHWFTDIVGGILLSVGLFCIYKAGVVLWGGNYGIS